MVLIHRSEQTDPISYLEVNHQIIAIGTACGAVRLISWLHEPGSFGVLTLAKRSPEAIAAIILDDQYVYSVAGDVAIKRWDLQQLKNDVPLVKGCTYVEVTFVMKHSVGQCVSSTTFAEGRNTTHGPRVIVMRQMGEACCTEIDTRQQRVVENVGPLPENDSQLVSCAFNGNRFLWAHKDADGCTTLKVWNVWDVPSEVPCKLTWNASEGDLGRARFIDDDTILFQREGQLVYWKLERSNAQVLKGTSYTCFIFDYFCVDSRQFIISMCPLGTITLMELCGTENAHTSPMVIRIASARTSAVARFFLGVPYFIRCRVEKDGRISVIYTDDVGVHIEENWYRM